jgi:hypothetical protein
MVSDHCFSSTMTALRSLDGARPVTRQSSRLEESGSWYSRTIPWSSRRAYWRTTQIARRLFCQEATSLAGGWYRKWWKNDSLSFSPMRF